jgi:glutamyl-tRNA synthetase
MENPELARGAVSVAKGTTDGTARKDLVRWSDFRDRYGFFFRELAGTAPSPDDDRFGGLPPSLVRHIAQDFAANYRASDDPDEWLGQLRGLAEQHGFAPDTRSWRRSSARYAGPPRQVVNVIRVHLTGATRSPDLFAVARVMGEAEVLRRLG